MIFSPYRKKKRLSLEEKETTSKATKKSPTSSKKASAKKAKYVRCPCLADS